MAMGLATSPRHAVEAGFTAARLMEYSEHFLARAALSEMPHRSQLAVRLLQDKPLHRRWENAHGLLMHGVAAPARPADRVVEMRKVSFLTLHRKAPFEYMRDRHVTGTARRHLIQALFGTQHYAQCLVREHMAFLHSACSLICVDALCREVLGDAAFAEALAHYCACRDCRSGGSTGGSARGRGSHAVAATGQLNVQYAADRQDRWARQMRLRCRKRRPGRCGRCGARNPRRTWGGRS